MNSKSYTELSLLEGADGHLEGAVAHVHKHHISRLLVLCGKVLLVNPVGQGSCRSIVEQPETVQSSDRTGVQQAPTLSVREK